MYGTSANLSHTAPLLDVEETKRIPSENNSAYGYRYQVNAAVLSKVLEWCEHHKNDPTPAVDDEADSRKKSTDIEEWDQKFMQVDQEMLFEIILVQLTTIYRLSSYRSYRRSNSRRA